MILNETVYNIVHLRYLISNCKQSLATGPEILIGDAAHACISTLFVYGSVFSILINIYPSDSTVVHLFQLLYSLN